MSKVLLVINTLGEGGAQRQILLLARTFIENKIHAEIIHFGRSGRLEFAVENKNIKITNLRGDTLLGTIWNLFRYIFSFRNDTLISYTDSANKICGVIAMFLPGLRWVPSERNLSVAKNFSEIFWRKALYWRAYAIVPNSDAQADWLSDVLSSMVQKISIIKNGVAPEIFLDHPSSDSELRYIDKTCKFLILARVSHQKNPKLLVEALLELKETAPILLERCRFDWYGDNDPGCEEFREELTACCNAEKLPVTFNPAHIDPVNLIRSYDCMILCSIHEGTPNVILEAMANNLLVVSSDVSDIPHILDLGKNGILYRSNSHQELMGSIITVLNMLPADRQNILNSARSYVNINHSSDSLFYKYKRLIAK